LLNVHARNELATINEAGYAWHDSGERVACMDGSVPLESRRAINEAESWFAALDQRVIGRGHARWVASVLRVHGDRRNWWIDVASAANPSANVVLRLSRRATVFHAVAALRRCRPRTESCAPVIDVMQVR
jgi:hypothetical protein